MPTSDGLSPGTLQVEYEASPRNLDPTRPPRFSWRIATDRRGAAQRAYRLVVSHNPISGGDLNGVLWDSGNVDSDRSTNVVYGGPDLASDTRYYWTVKVWTDGGETEWADPEPFSTALRPADWTGEWIAHQPGVGDTDGWRSEWHRPDDDAEEWVQIDLGEPHTVDEITLRHAETLTDAGDLATVDLRSARATDTYVARGDTRETYEPRLTYHGFRYAQIEGYPGEFDPDAVTAKVVHTAMDRRGEFACSNDDLNQVQHNAVWGLAGNAHSIPEDCPQRDERFGWTGDAQIAARSLAFNFDAARFHEKWARDHDDAASDVGYVPDVIPNKAPEDPGDPAWTITRVVLPWYRYRHDGDERFLAAQYEGMREHVKYWLSVTADDLVPPSYGRFGDWLAFENTDGRRGLPYDLFTTAFVYQITDVFAKIADVLDNDGDADRYREWADRLRVAFTNEFFEPTKGRYWPGTQASYAVLLFLGLVPDDHVETVAERLAEKVRSDGGKLKTGFLGTRPLIKTLAEHGYDDLAYEVVSQPERPGWVYMARKGATTMWERWNSDDSIGSGMNSLNHSPLTHVSEYLFEVLAGIRIGDRPVTDHVTIAPSLVEDLEWVYANYDTRNGELAVVWERTDEGYDLSVTIPWNVEATVRLPDAAAATVAESGVDLIPGMVDAPDGISAVDQDDDTVVATVGTGEFDFSIR